MVTREEGLAFAEESGCLFLESSAKTRENVLKCFEELALKVCLEKDIVHHNVICLEPFFPWDFKAPYNIHINMNFMSSLGAHILVLPYGSQSGSILALQY